MNPRLSYATDVTDTEWELVRPYVPKAKPGGRPEVYPKREILNGIFYIVRGGGAWRLLPHDFPPWQIRAYLDLFLPGIRGQEACGFTAFIL